jgi:HNH endonuclease
MGTKRKIPERIDTFCVSCGNQFTHTDIHYAPTPKYCSHKCRRSVYLNIRGTKDVKKTCVTCGSVFIGFKAKNNIYCSPKCRPVNMSKSAKAIKCDTCGEPIMREPNRISKTNFCGYVCMAAGKIRDYPKSRKFNSVRRWFSRCGRMAKCERCGYNDIPRILVLHHKDRDRTNNERENLEVLCPNCHATEHVNELKDGWTHFSTDPRKVKLRSINSISEAKSLQ